VTDYVVKGEVRRLREQQQVANEMLYQMLRIMNATTVDGLGSAMVSKRQMALFNETITATGEAS